MGDASTTASSPNAVERLIASHQAQLDQSEQQLVATFDALDSDTNANVSLSDLAQVAQVIDDVRNRQTAIAAAASDNPATPPDASPPANIARPSIAQLSNAPRPSKRSTAPVIRARARTHIADGAATIVDALYNQLTSGRFRQSARHNTGRPDSPTPQASLPYEQAVVASLTWDLPNDRQLTTDDPTITTQAMAASISSLVAAGGICGPIAVDYDIPTFATSQRPVKAGLPSFQATRGGINYTLPPKLTDAVSGTMIWTTTKDTDGTSTKPCLTIQCQPTQQVLVHGIPTCTTLGNMQSRYNPELVNAWLQTTEAAAARVAELALLSAINAGSTQATVTPKGLGAARELLPAIDQAAAGIRYRQRQLRTSPTLRVILPEWVRDLVRADIARELAHDNDTTQGDALALADTRLDNWFSQRAIVPVWSLEDIDGTLAGAQAAGPLNAWPTKVTFPIFADGTWVFLDGGRLDVGLIRDSALNSTNQAQMFVEPFEAVAFRGLESVAVTIDLTDSGLSAGSVDTSAP